MSERQSMSTAERVTFTAAVGILVILAGSIFWLWAQPREPVIVTVAPSGDRRVIDSQTYVTARVRNSGDDTAQAVQVRAELTVDGEVVAEGEADDRLPLRRRVRASGVRLRRDRARCVGRSPRRWPRRPLTLPAPGPFRAQLRARQRR